jgi:hypothetical protein
MANSLEDFIAYSMQDDEVSVMNILCEHCPLVSDNAVWASDVHNTGEVIAWIHRNPQHFRRIGLGKTKKRP